MSKEAIARIKINNLIYIFELLFSEQDSSTEIRFHTLQFIFLLHNFNFIKRNISIQNNFLFQFISFGRTYV